MKSGRHTMDGWGTKRIRRIPTLVDLCVQKAIDNVRYLGDVGETDQHLLERILPHCTMDQIKHIEEKTKGRDLSPVTDKLWKNFYVQQFGSKNANDVVDKMKKKGVSHKWSELYKIKLEVLEEAEQNIGERLKQRYSNANAMKQSRQVQLCTKVPPSSNKRCFYGGPGINLGNTKSGLMKKAKLEFLNSREVKNLSAMKKATVHRTPSVTPIRKPSLFHGSSSTSSSKFSTPTARRF
uniref:uncharacterized protein LOC122609702 n=1 Tax=Erigeron canadensis TaxID=72917 RepID=UPI001CB9A39B|nr:uncharacterized protein LOC122609702 [Erigeron canadensis]XP_043638596.1 uncharacterized protein LOC122609702 [Erigeron canadensis]